MAWTDWPVVVGTTEIRKYSWLVQLWRACRERAWALGAEFWPRTTLIQDTEAASSYCKYAPGYTGAVDAIGTGTALTDFSKSWATDRWYDFVGPDPASPRFYDVLIEFDELNPWGVVRTKILGNSATVLTIEQGPLLDLIAAGLISAMADLKHCRYCIVRQNQFTHRSLHWHDRWPDWPNARELAAGIVALPTATTIDDAQQNWSVGQFAGKDLMTLVGGRLKRFPVTGNTKNQLTFTNGPGVPPDAGAGFAVIPAGAKWNYGRNPPAAWRWYGGADGGPTSDNPGVVVDPRFYSHQPDHTVLPTPVAAYTINLMQTNDDASACVEVDVDAFDNDVWSATTFDDDPLSCDAYDRPYSPDLYKTFRGLQAWLEGVSPEFIEKKSYDNLAAIPPFTAATWLRAAGINAYTTTVASINRTFMTFGPIAFPPEALNGLVHYAVLDDDGVPLTYGVTYAASTVNGTWGGTLGLLVSNGRINLRGPTAAESLAFDYPPPQDYLDTFVGKRLVISLGWTRLFPREFRYLYEKTVFVADGGAGFYVTRPASSRYVERDVIGRAIDSDTPAFKDKELARYAGDLWCDPTLPNDSAQGGIDPDSYYRDKFFTGVAPPEGGLATSGTTRSLRDTTASDQRRWWSVGARHTESGTATAGGTTNLSDSGKAANPYWAAGTGRWAGFVVEIEMTGGEWARRPIAAYDAATQTVSWEEALPGAASAAGRKYQIREPGDTTASGSVTGGELNRWKNRTLRIHLPGKTVERAVTHSDDDTLYFADVSADLLQTKNPDGTWTGLTSIPPGTAYTLIERQPGEVLQWNQTSPGGTGSWLEPAGTDTRGTAPVKFHRNPRENLPTVARKFGRACHRDYVSRRLLNEMYNGINALAWTKAEGFWRNDTLPPSYNSRATNGEFAIDLATAEADVDAQFTTGHYPDPGVQHVDTNDSTLLPAALKQTQSGSNFADIYTADSWAILPNVKTVRIKHAADAYAYTSADRYDVTQGPLPRPPNLGSPSSYVLTDDPSSGGYLHFDAQGSGARYRAFGLMASKGASFDSSEAIKVGDYTALPPHWPPASGSTVEQPNPNDYAGWSVAAPNGVGTTNPIIILRWDVAGGFTYVAGANPVVPAAGVGASGVFPLTL